MPIFKSLVLLDPGKILNLGSSALEADALTTRPTRRCQCHSGVCLVTEIVVVAVVVLTVVAEVILTNGKKVIPFLGGGKL